MRPPATALITLLVSSVLATACAKDETCSAPGVLVSIGVDANVKIEDIVKIGIEASLDTSRRTGELSAGAVGLGSGDADRFALTFTNKEITSTHTLELTLSAFDRDGALVAIGRADPAITVRAGEACASAVVTLLPPTGGNAAVVDLSKPGAKPDVELTATAGTGPIVVCDFNGDGVDDIAFAAPQADGELGRQNAGEVYLLFGPELGGAQGVTEVTKAQVAMKVVGGAPGDGIGASLACADLDGMRGDDLIIGAPEAGNAGRVYVFFGRTKPTSSVIDLSTASADAEIGSANAGDRFGAALAVARGFASGKLGSLIVGAPGAGSGGAAYIIGGRDEAAWGAGVDLATDGALLTVVGAAGEGLGAALASGNLLGDTDDRQDVAIGAPQGGKSGCSDCGVVRVVAAKVIAASATIDVAQGEHALTVWGASGASKLGQSLAIGDHDGDGLGDLLIGAPNDEGKGKVYVVVGDASLLAASGQPANAIEIKDGHKAVYLGTTGSQLGSAVAASGGAGSRADLIVGAPGIDSSKGAVYQFVGHALAPKETIQLEDARLKTVLGAKQNDRLGASVASGLFGSDSAVDLIIAAPGAKTVYGIFSTK